VKRARSTIPVDVLNPGQVFACYGLIDLAELLWGDVRAGFVDDSFVIEAKGEVEPVKGAVDFIAHATVTAVIPRSATSGQHRLLSKQEAKAKEEAKKAADKSKKETEKRLKQENEERRKRGEPPLKKEKDEAEREETLFVADTVAGDGDVYPSPGNESAKLVARLSRGTAFIDVDHWAEATSGTGRDNVKFWAGAGGMPGVVMIENAIDLVREEKMQTYADPLNFQRPQSSSFRFDWRAGYVPMDIGWSLNNHPKAKNGGYPLVDVLAAIGLSSARPRAVRKHAECCAKRWCKLHYRYGVLQGEGHRPLFLRAALGGALAGFSRREFQIELGWPGKEGQARAIVGVTEFKAERV
jgi:CRISPR-associated protein Csx14